jgi:hypothetical protein
MESRRNGDSSLSLLLNKKKAFSVCGHVFVCLTRLIILAETRFPMLATSMMEFIESRCLAECFLASLDEAPISHMKRLRLPLLISFSKDICIRGDLGLNHGKLSVLIASEVVTGEYDVGRSGTSY